MFVGTRVDNGQMVFQLVFDGIPICVASTIRWRFVVVCSRVTKNKNKPQQNTYRCCYQVEFSRISRYTSTQTTIIYPLSGLQTNK